MKICFSLQLCLGLVLFLGCLISKTTSNVKQWYINCAAQSAKQAYCARTTYSLNYTPTIDMRQIEVKHEVLYLEAHLSFDGPWMIDNLSMFDPFISLLNLRIIGPPTFNTAEIKNSVGSRLFEPLSRLKSLALWYWNATDEFNWKFPKGLTNLELVKCGFRKLNLSSYTNLKSLSVRWNNLTQMPILSSPPPPLEKLYLADNDNISFTANNLKNLCKLRAISLTKFNPHLNETAKFCECKNLKTFLKQFRIKEVEGFDCFDATPPINCTHYPVDAVMLEHNRVCNLTHHVTTPTTSTMGSNITESSTKSTTSKPVTIKITPRKTPKTSSKSPNAVTITSTERTRRTRPMKTTELKPTESLDQSTPPPLVCPSCPGCTLPVIGWSFFTLVLLSAGAGVATYVVVKRRLLFFN